MRVEMLKASKTVVCDPFWNVKHVIIHNLGASNQQLFGGFGCLANFGLIWMKTEWYILVSVCPAWQGCCDADMPDKPRIQGIKLLWKPGVYRERMLVGIST